jgi:hypothetical protein
MPKTIKNTATTTVNGSHPERMSTPATIANTPRTTLSIFKSSSLSSDLHVYVGVIYYYRFPARVTIEAKLKILFC